MPETLLEMPPVPKPRSLLQIGDSMQALRTALEETEGELTPLLAEQWDADTADLETKADNYAAMIREFELSAKARREESTRLLDLARADEARAKAMKERLLFVLRQQGMKHLKTRRYNLSVCQNSAAPVELLVDVIALPLSITKIDVKPDLEKIREYLLTNKPGISEFARLGEPGEHLRIR